MHPSAEYTAKLFFDTYIDKNRPLVIGEVGAGADTFIRSLVSSDSSFIAIDSDNESSDINLSDPYSFPLESNSVDAVLSSSCFEHSEFFWLTFNETMRILKPGGLFYLNAPSSGAWHRYPVDCWRFYPDSGHALVKWAKRSGHNDVALVESFLCHYDTHWHDYVAVFIKDVNHLEEYPNRLLNNINSDLYTNGLMYGQAGILQEDPAFEQHRTW